MTAGEKQWTLKHTPDYQTCRWMRMRVIKVIIRHHANKRVILNGYRLIGKLITSVLKCNQLKLINDHSGVKTGNYNRLSITQRKGYPALELWLFRCEPKTEKNRIIIQKFIKHDLGCEVWNFNGRMCNFHITSDTKCNGNNDSVSTPSDQCISKMFSLVHYFISRTFIPINIFILFPWL